MHANRGLLDLCLQVLTNLSEEDYEAAIEAVIDTLVYIEAFAILSCSSHSSMC